MLFMNSEYLLGRTYCFVDNVSIETSNINRVKAVTSGKYLLIISICIHDRTFQHFNVDRSI